MAISKARRAIEALKSAGLTLASAESCTGGLIAKQATDISGASAVFHGGVVSYVNAVKHEVLGVSQKDLDKYGAVSAPVGRQMAEGARRLLKADLALSTTGVAGPDRDDRGNDVGTVYVTLAAAGGTWVYLCHFTGSRSAIRRDAAAFAYTLVLRYLVGEDLAEGAL